MNILVISGSPRKGGNTEIMVDAFADGAKESGNEVTIKKMSALTVAPCHACEYCFAHDGVCVQKDDMAEILAAVDVADMIVFASPIYWFGMSAQTKAVIDRLYAFARHGFHPRYTALLLDSMSPGVFEGAIAEYKATNSYLKWEDKGIITISGMGEKGSMAKSDQLESVRALGKSIK
ncbi:MAG: flavodoxin family protein [Oscillospiraceae bacterium]